MLIKYFKEHWEGYEWLFPTTFYRVVAMWIKDLQVQQR